MVWEMCLTGLMETLPAPCHGTFKHLDLQLEFLPDCRARVRQHLYMLVQRPLSFEFKDHQAGVRASLNLLYRSRGAVLESRCQHFPEVFHALDIRKFRSPSDRANPLHD